MKTLIAFVLLICAGCGGGVSEQEKLAKRFNDKMDREERTQREEKERNTLSTEETIRQSQEIRRRIKIMNAEIIRVQASQKGHDDETKHLQLKSKKMKQELRDINAEREKVKAERIRMENKIFKGIDE